jgi:hypothetical protein
VEQNVNLLCACQTAEMGFKAIQIDCCARLLSAAFHAFARTDYRHDALSGAPILKKRPSHTWPFSTPSTRTPQQGVGLQVNPCRHLARLAFQHLGPSQLHRHSRSGVLGCGCGIAAPVRCESPVDAGSYPSCTSQSVSPCRTAAVMPDDINPPGDPIPPGPRDEGASQRPRH